MPKATVVIFNLDGTLIDSREGIMNSVFYALNKLGMKDASIHEVERFIGPPIRECFSKIYQFNEEKTEKALEYYREYYSEHGISQNQLYDGMLDLLNQLKENGKHLFVATSKPLVYADKILEHLNVRDYFTDVMGSHLDGTYTDKTEVIKVLLERNKSICAPVSPEDLWEQRNEENLSQSVGEHLLSPVDFMELSWFKNIVMIGDRKLDIQGAVNNRILSIGVTYGYGRLEEIIASTPTYMATSVFELAEVLLHPDGD